MDVYHKVLVKLYEVTGGRDSQTVDFKELVKSQGFFGNYEDILQMLSGQGWIAETTKTNYVKITHWGVKEARNSAAGTSADSSSQETTKTVNRLKSETKEFLAMLEEFADDLTKENFGRIEKKMGELGAAVNKIKESL